MFIIDVTLSKFCDLIPVERFSAMAKRQGGLELPPNSLIEQTHHLANFVLPAAKRVAAHLLTQRVLYADETTHRMLEGHKTSSWYVWGFSDGQNVVFEHQPTRSGEVASDVLTASKCEVLVSDVFSGYSKAVRLVNDRRDLLSHLSGARLKPVISSYCNAHARRKFHEARKNFKKESLWFIERYKDIYAIEKQVKKSTDPKRRQSLRMSMHPIFQDMKFQAQNDQIGVSKHSALGKAISYFLKNYESFIIPVWDHEVQLDNNAQERAFRNPVVGRKTWYGTHSVRGAQTATIHLTLIESCRLSLVNPREYYAELVKRLHRDDPPITPYEYSLIQSQTQTAH